MPPTRIVGQLVQFQGSVSLIGTIVAVFRNYADYVQYRPAQPPTVLRTGNVFQASFVVDILEPGRYWFDAWKDVNDNGCRDAGDRLASYRDWGLYEEQFDVPEFHTVDLGQLLMRESGAPCAEGP